VIRAEHLRIAVLALLVLAGPTAGDIGSCGQDVVDLDPQKFFLEKSEVDCDRCEECGYDSDTCIRACFDNPPVAFAAGCFPLVHDGEVCLNALRAASCDDYAAFIDDVAPTVPGECNFCPPGQQPAPPTTGAGGGGGGEVEPPLGDGGGL
jgi:hypothetical protein